jgi:hypothetical protein
MEMGECGCMNGYCWRLKVVGEEGRFEVLDNWRFKDMLRIFDSSDCFWF